MNHLLGANMTKWRIILIGGESFHVQEILDCLGERHSPVEKICLLAEQDRYGEINEFRGEPLLVGRLEDIPEEGYHGAVLLSPITNLKDTTATLVRAGIPLYDLSGSITPSAEVPVIFPEYWDRVSHGIPRVAIIPSPITILCGLISKPIHSLSPVKSITISMMQGTAQTGSRRAMDELFDQTRNILGFKDITIKEFPKQIAFNTFPADDIAKTENRTKLEMRHFLATEKLTVNVDLYWAGFFVGMAGTLWIETEDRLEEKVVKSALNAAPALIYDETRPGPGILDIVGKDQIFISGLRCKNEDTQGLTVRFTMDNLRKGLSTNLAQTFELLYQKD
jgi:aspartate-semialdehyde dehydrogenase